MLRDNKGDAISRRNVISKINYRRMDIIFPAFQGAILWERMRERHINQRIRIAFFFISQTTLT